MNVDDLVRSYYGLLGCAQDMVDSRGRVYAKGCGDCGGHLRHWKEAEELWVCGHCGAPWPWEDRLIPKGEVQRSIRPGEHEERLAGLARFGYELNAMLRSDHWRWKAQVLVGYAVTSATYGDIAWHANECGWPTPHGDRQWTESMARWHAGEARRELRRRLFR